METDEDLIGLPASGDSGCGIETKQVCNSNSDASEADGREDKVDMEKEDPQKEVSNSNCDASEADVKEEDKEEMENLGYKEEDAENQVIDGINTDKDLVDNPSIMEVSISLTETVTVEEKSNSSDSRVDTENGNLTAQDENLTGDRMIDGIPVSGVKRARMTLEEQKPLVRVIYDSLTRESKRKLEELLQKWSEWDAQHCSSTRGQIEVLESGEDTYYPALYVGRDKPSAVSFWMENQTRNQQNKELISMDCDSVPHYDRGYALGLTSLDGSNNLEGGLDLIDASRCFNCGSYNHALKQCPKPRNNAAVNNARKQQKSRRNQNAGTRNPTRYYQNSSGGKYDGLRPGALDAETRQLLGLGELDPPPWLNRMREIGYPPGYLDPEDEDQPSGITIFGDEEDNNKVEQEDGEILDTDYPEPQKKMSVEFPGINAPIPENADERRWAALASSSEPPWNRSQRRFNHPSEPYSREHYREQRWSQEFRDDGPPGCDPGVSPSSSYPPSYGNYDSSYSYHNSRGNIQTPKSPSFGRSSNDRGRRSPLDREGSLGRGSYSSSSYLSSNRRPSSHNHGSSSFENLAPESRNEPTPDNSSYSREKRHTHHYHDRR